MRIGVLTSSRADFGIYLPLLNKFRVESINIEIIAFGTHLSHQHGYTVTQIIESGFDVRHKIETVLAGDSPEAISSSIGLTCIKFSSFWAVYGDIYDIVFCLGDRYEMFAAVSAGIPFNIKFAHIHGGEKTLGAMDNIFRHSISLASSYHFVSTQQYADRLLNLLDNSINIFNTGALSLDNLADIHIYSITEFSEKWNIDLAKPTVLTTFHPETVEHNLNETYTNELCKVIEFNTQLQFLITMPNADTSGNLVRGILNSRLRHLSHVKMIENFGTQGYFSAMQHCKLLLGNTSSGIIEAASFKKYVINIGNRQLGRLGGGNIISCGVTFAEINEAIAKILNMSPWDKTNIYYNGGASDKIVSVIKSIHKN